MPRWMQSRTLDNLHKTMEHSCLPGNGQFECFKILSCNEIEKSLPWYPNSNNFLEIVLIWHSSRNQPLLWKRYSLINYREENSKVYYSNLVLNFLVKKRTSIESGENAIRYGGYSDISYIMHSQKTNYWKEISHDIFSSQSITIYVTKWWHAYIFGNS